MQEQPQQLQRPRYTPLSGGFPETSSLSSPGGTDVWLAMLHCVANFPPELFEVAIESLVHHPEYNSTLILRSEVIAESTTDLPDLVPSLKRLKVARSIHRKLLPRRPGRDAGLEQHCTFYYPNDDNFAENSCQPEHDELPRGPSCVLVLTPITEPGCSLPYYHPAVSHLAFRYIPTPYSVTPGIIQIEVVPLPDVPTDLNSRLYRTCLALLETLHRYGWGAMTNFKKRVNHDCIVPREEYQDFYLVMRERHKQLVGEWKESTDPLKHVFEDIAIATFLMLLWKQMYPTTSIVEPTESSEKQPWHAWGRPPSGFLDLGCGNGLLTHILVSEGYDGEGIDLRKRISWEHYSEATQRHLHVEALDPTAILPTSYFKSGIFLIGNHADELTPWVPVLSTLCNASGYLSIPCCPWTFDMKFERSKHPPYPLSVSREDFVTSLSLGGDGSNTSAYSMYRIWLASLHAHCGWVVECETLRIPSTRNWALVGRSRSTEDRAERRRNVEEIIEAVRTRGVFKTRRPEGKAGEH